ncbi:MAG: hypothetical protein C5B50_20395, partial [Verrucomicrobia bacterium]
HGNTNTCTFTVTINDAQPPVLTCPTNMNLVADAGQCSRSNVTFSVTANDNCGSATVISVPPSGSTFPVGVTTVTNIAFDTHGNTNTCTFTVTINDTQPPVLTCPTNMNLVADAGQCSRSNVTFSVTANDNCGSVSVISVPPSGSTFPVGVTMVTNIAFDNHGNTNTCTFTVTILSNGATLAATGPTNQSVCPGSTVVLSTVASGNGPFAYQWYKGGGPLLGETASTLTLTNVGSDDAATYSVIIVGQCASVTNSAVLALYASASATGPNNQTNCPGTTAVFSTSAAGTGPFSFQWLKNGTNISGATSSSLTLSSVSSNDVAIYAVIATGHCGSITNSATLTLYANTAATPLTSALRNPGGSVTFSTTASGTGPFTYSWTFNGNVISGATSSTLTLNNLSSTNAGTYTVQVTGHCNSASQSATLSINAPPTVTILNPTNGSVFLTPASFDVIADARANPNRPNSLITNVSFFLFTTNFLGQTNMAPYFVPLTNLAPGTYTFSATATDDLGLTGVSSNVTVTVISNVPLTVITAMHFDPQNGLFEETVRVGNPSAVTNSIQVLVTGLTTNMTLFNATGTNNGVPYVQSFPVAPGATVDLVLQYYVHNSSATPNPTLTARLVTPPSGGGVTFVGTPQHINRGKFLANKSFLVEFASVTNKTYYVQISTDFVNWFTVQPSITGNGTFIQFVDSGQPGTPGPPMQSADRFYRVISVP